jgi:uncharacterized membrane-anchored protein
VRERVAVAAAALVLLLTNYTIYRRERLLTEGRVVLLELAPVDPRSLMQGDYMALRFKVANDAFPGRAPFSQTSDGRLVLSLDARGVASFARFDEGGPLPPNHARMRYRMRDQQPKFATNAFFFQEGQAALYQRARYGEFRVGEDGDSILTALRGEDLARLGPR